MPRVHKQLVIGLDCVPPALAFDAFADAMPHLTALRKRGTWGALRSVTPPITVPAWACMTTGLDPGELGLYGFRNRVPNSYALALATAEDLHAPAVWDRLAATGANVAALFVPPSWPPRPLRGTRVSCFLAPGEGAPFAYPHARERELTERFGAYLPDVSQYRGADKDTLFRELDAMRTQHFAMLRALWQSERLDFAMMVEIGPDRLHHALWRERFTEPRFRAYYAALDAELGECIALAGEDTAVLVVSDHGAQDLRGSVCINEWLMRHGWLVLRGDPPATPRALAPELVDWSRTRAWGEGGYFARLFLNVRGREPTGIIAPEARDGVASELAAALATIALEDGTAVRTEAVEPSAIYSQTHGFPPDLMAFFDGLRYRSAGTIGHGRLALPGNDGAPDGCNHAYDGIFVLAGGRTRASGHVDGLAIADVAPTLLHLAGLPVPSNLRGRDRSGLA